MFDQYSLFSDTYSSPLTVWYQACSAAITQIKWCQLYFEEDGSRKEAQTGNTEESRFTARLCEFFAIDQNETFIIWNLQKDKRKSCHQIKFGEKHTTSNKDRKIFQISTTCADQSFFTAFEVKDFKVKIYLMNFKKGGEITRERLTKENKQSLAILNTLPTNALGMAESGMNMLMLEGMQMDHN
jgi:ribonuclease BN (tRNA processing enzyme)